jgi:hypothetical protein
MNDKASMPDFRLECMTGQHEACAESGLACECECHAPPGKPVKRFSYLTIHPEVFPCDDELNELGKKGWEVYSVDKDPSGAVIVSLKRELLDG